MTPGARPARVAGHRPCRVVTNDELAGRLGVLRSSTAPDVMKVVRKCRALHGYFRNLDATETGQPMNFQR
jgi:hypothetical protein